MTKVTDKLYHGTSAALIPRLEREGLLPRTHSKNKGNWGHTVPSNPKAVYLTDAYAWHFAAASSKDTGLILEIDKSKLKPWKLAPDEDFLEQVSRKIGPPEHPHLAPTDWSMKKRTLFYRKTAIRDFAHLTEESLSHGNGRLLRGHPLVGRDAVCVD
jgi:hypothetical protein